MDTPSRSRPAVTWRVWLSLVMTPLALMLSFASFAAYLVLVRSVGPDDLPRTIESSPVVPGAFGFGLALLLTWWLARRDGSPPSSWGWTRPSLLDLVVGAVAATALAALNAYVLHPLVQRFQPSFDPTVPTVTLAGAALMLAIAVVAEDSIYRGYAFQALWRRYGAPIAFAVTTFFYVLVTPGEGFALRIWTLYFGLILCALRLWRGNLWPVVIVHFLVGLSPKLLASL
jgi:membrane protease YdiL (CAAX protease family)